VFADMAPHDLILPYELPGWLSAPATVKNVHLQRPFTWLPVRGQLLFDDVIPKNTGRSQKRRGDDFLRRRVEYRL
jgi:hypothetical protein